MQEDYRKKDLEVNRSQRKDKIKCTYGIAQETENAAKLGHMNGVYATTRRLCCESPKRIVMVRKMDGIVLANKEEMRQRWKEHFAEVLKRPNPEQAAGILC